MSLLKLEIVKFTIGGDFSLWKMKMRTLFFHQGLESALEEKDSGKYQVMSPMTRKD